MSVASTFLVAVWLVVVLAVRSGAYRPMILVHGLAITPHSGMENLRKVIQEESPGAEVYLVRAFSGETSLTTPLWEQVHTTYEEVKEILHSAPNGVTFICFSQGDRAAFTLLGPLPSSHYSSPSLPPPSLLPPSLSPPPLLLSILTSTSLFFLPLPLFPSLSPSGG